MSKKRLIWQLYPSYLLIILASIFFMAVYAFDSFETFYTDQHERDLEVRAELLQSQYAFFLEERNYMELDRLCKKQGKQTSTRITVILPNGQVVADSEENPEKMNNHADRPEIVDAFKSGVGKSRRFSDTLQSDMTYVAIPARLEGKFIGVVRTSIPLSFIDRALEDIYTKVALVGLVVMLLAALVSLFVSRKINRPLYVMEEGARRFAEGDLHSRLPVFDSLELGSLSQAMNAMASQLDERIQTVMRQRNELDAVLSSMIEGVLAVDENDRIIIINESAASLLDIKQQQATGQKFSEAVTDKGFKDFVYKSRKARKMIEGEVVLLFNSKELTLQLQSTVLHDSEGNEIGVLAVFNDITRLRRLENIRRDFVSNVSHELRTPVTSIKGFVETLLDGAAKDPKNARRFLKIIAKQTERLNAIIEDLLTLSRLDNNEDEVHIALRQTPLNEVLKAAIQICDLKASEKNISISLDCPQNLAANLNSILFEQVIINLVDNAVKYSPDSSRVKVSAAKTDNKLEIVVKDEGNGIPAEHLSRIFERFYRVDKARSRVMGGTGLGLAIVKHIVNAHSGSINVESQEGQGSTFTISLPLA